MDTCLRAKSLHSQWWKGKKTKEKKSDTKATPHDMTNGFVKFKAHAFPMTRLINRCNLLLTLRALHSATCGDAALKELKSKYLVNYVMLC